VKLEIVRDNGDVESRELDMGSLDEAEGSEGEERQDH
jgi:hypothetical protein